MVARQQAGPIGSSPKFTAEPINAPWAIARSYNGQGIDVAVIDSGLNAVDDLGIKTQGNDPHIASPIVRTSCQMRPLPLTGMDMAPTSSV